MVPRMKTEPTAPVQVTANVSNAGGGMWSTSGTGTFFDPNALATLYTPSAADSLAGSVTLTATTTVMAPCSAVSDDLVINFGEGYRASSTTALGGIPVAPFQDNVKPWSGDHVVDPTLVPGVCFSNRPIRTDDVSMLDMAPTILHALGVPKGEKMEGGSLLR